MTVPHRVLKILAALVWYIGGFVLLWKGMGLLVEADELGAGRHWRWLAPSMAIVVGGVKSGLLFTHRCRKNLARIDALDDPRVWQFFASRFFLFLAVMIAAGAALSHVAHGHIALLIGVSILDLSVSSALLSSSYVFWKRKLPLTDTLRESAY